MKTLHESTVKSKFSSLIFFIEKVKLRNLNEELIDNLDENYRKLNSDFENAGRNRLRARKI